MEHFNDFQEWLASVIEAKVKCAIPALAQGPYRYGVYDPVLGDGMAVNILSFQEAGILRNGNVVKYRMSLQEAFHFTMH